MKWKTKFLSDRSSGHQIAVGFTVGFFCAGAVAAPWLVSRSWLRSYMHSAQEDGDFLVQGEPRMGHRRFYVLRHEDVTGISGEGVPVEGVVFSDGWGVTHWLDRPPMNEPKTEVWHHPGVEPFEKVSGHGGRSEVVWVDEQ